MRTLSRCTCSKSWNQIWNRLGSGHPWAPDRESLRFSSRYCWNVWEGCKGDGRIYLHRFGFLYYYTVLRAPSKNLKKLQGTLRSLRQLQSACWAGHRPQFPSTGDFQGLQPYVASLSREPFKQTDKRMTKVHVETKKFPLQYIQSEFASSLACCAAI